MKKTISLFLLVLIALPNVVGAKVKPEFEWHLVNEQPKRTLHVCFHRSLNEQWQGWAKSAIDEWNKHKEETGWSFEIVPFTRDRCQVFIVLRDINEKTNAGARFDPLDTLEGQDEEDDGRANAAIITIDSNLELTKEWITEEEDVEDGAHDGWSTDRDDGTRDPIDTIMHELSHALRLDHHDDYDPGAPDEDISDPKQPGEHYHELSEKDIAQAKDSSTAEFNVSKEDVGATGARNLELGKATLDVPQYAFGYEYRDYEVVYQEATDIMPDPLAVPEGFSHVFYSFGFFSDGQVQNDITIRLPYEEAMLESVPSPLETAEGFYPPGLVEGSISVVRFEKRPWDLTPVEISPNPSSWELVDGAALDTEENVVEFVIDEAGYYGLVAQVDPEQPPLDPGYSRAVDGKIVHEEGIQRIIFIREFKQSVVSQIPAFAVGFFVGGFIACLWCGGKKRKKKNLERHESEPLS